MDGLCKDYLIDIVVGYVISAWNLLYGIVSPQMKKYLSGHVILSICTFLFSVIDNFLFIVIALIFVQQMENMLKHWIQHQMFVRNLSLYVVLRKCEETVWRNYFMHSSCFLGSCLRFKSLSARPRSLRKFHVKIHVECPNLASDWLAALLTAN